MASSTPRSPSRTENEIRELNQDLLKVLVSTVTPNPALPLIDFFRIRGDMYTRALRKICLDDNIVDVGTSEHLSCTTKPQPTSLLDRGRRLADVNSLITKINHQCQAEQGNGSLAFQYRHVDTESLVSLVPTGETIWSVFGQAIIKINRDLVVKRGRLELQKLEEAANIQLVRHLTSVPVPEIVRVHADEREMYIFMAFLAGTPLQDLWATMTNDSKERIASQLKIHMDDLRSVPPPSPCYFGSVESHICIDCRELTRITVNQNRPISSEAEFNKFVMTDLNLRHHDEYCSMLLSMQRCNHKIVLTHGDFHPRNIIVKDDVVIAIIDWEFAGWYPEYWEYVKALNVVGPVVDWWRYLPKIIDTYYQEWAIDRQIQNVMIMR